MIDSKIIFKIIGQLLFIEAFMMLVCLLMSYCYGEHDTLAFMVSTLLTLCGGVIFKYLGRNASNNLNRREAYLVVTLTWIVFSFFGMFPYLAGGYITNITDAYFETISGFTTTGATIMGDVERMPHAILFWRTMTQWIGGLGIVFFTIAILPSMGGGSMKIFAAEATGPIKSKLHPRVSTSAKWLWSIYMALTIGCLVAFWLCGMDWFDSINYSMTTTATGGFATHNDGLNHYNSPAVEYVAILFQFLAGINFMLLYMVVFKGKIRDLLKNSEFKLYITIILIATIWITLLLIYKRGFDTEGALRASLFHVVSMLTTTGLFMGDISNWPQISMLILACCMFLGACAGSTSGGFKCIRSMMLLSVLRNEFRRILHPNAVLPIKVNGQAIPNNKLPSLLAFFTASIVMCIVVAAMMVMVGVGNRDAITISLSCVSNVGLSLGTGGSDLSWAMLPWGIKWALTLLMLMGRLEIMTVLVLFTKSFWHDN